MAKGQKSKIDIQNKILEIFANSFIYGKEIRIPMLEDGEEIQIKITLTAAKENVTQGEDTILPGVKDTKSQFYDIQNVESNKEFVEISQEEKDNIKNLLKSIGL